MSKTHAERAIKDLRSAEQELSDSELEQSERLRKLVALVRRFVEAANNGDLGVLEGLFNFEEL